MILTFYQLNNKQDSGQCTASSVPLIPKWMGLPRTEDPTWACPSAMPDGHGFVEEYLTRVKEDIIHVVIPCLYHMIFFPKIINIGWGVSVSEPKLMSDGVKATFRHELTQEIGEWICILIKGDDTPKIPPIPYIEYGN